MNINLFKYAVEVERTRSITQAAENLYMAQPNLSKAIRELEDSVGITIFERTSKGVTPTRKGAEFLIYAKSILDQVEKIERLNTPSDTKKQHFGISIPRDSYIAQVFTKFVSELDHENEIDLHVQETNSMQAINNIVEEKFKLGIIRYQTAYENYFLDYLKEKKLSYEEIWEFEYLAVMSSKHPLANSTKLLYDDLKHFTEIVYGDTFIPYLSSVRSHSIHEESYAKDKGRKRIYVYERCSQFELLSYIPTTYMWGSPIPEELLARYDLVQHKCNVSKNKYKDLLVYPHGYKFTEIDKKFIGKLYDSRNEAAFRNTPDPVNRLIHLL